MADRRSVRSASRRKTPTPQPPSTATTPQAGRSARKRGTRSASREVADAPIATRNARRNARSASVASEEARVELPRQRGGKDKQKQKQALHDLSTVEEVEDAPNTPPRTIAAPPLPHRSPGAISEMSGTTAITSFSMAEAEELDAEIILDHLDDLYSQSRKLLELLVPDKGGNKDDEEKIREMGIPGSKFNAKFNAREESLESQLAKYRKPPQLYIRRRTVLRALFGNQTNLDSIQSNVDLIIYKANLIVFAKLVVPIQRDQKFAWDAIRELDTQFPSLFLHHFDIGQQEADHHGSRLLDETFALALEIRTQLAILVLQHVSQQNSYDPDESLKEVFFTLATNDTNPQVRGWEIAELGGGETPLPRKFSDDVLRRVQEIRKFFLTDIQSLENNDLVNFDELGPAFAWDAFVLKVLNWVRFRNREIDSHIQRKGGVDAFINELKNEVSLGFEDHQSISVHVTPQKKRISTSSRRRSSRNFDPVASVDDDIIDIIKSKGQLHAATAPAGSSDQTHEPAQRKHHSAAQDEHENIPADQEEDIEEFASSSVPPRSSAAILERIERYQKVEKENSRDRPRNQQPARRYIDPQEDAERITWSDDAEENHTQQDTATSRKGKAPQHSAPISKRRRRQADEESDEDESAFEIDARVVDSQSRRENATVLKRARFAGPSSSAPPSHQPRARSENQEYQPEEEDDDSRSENDAPDMTEEPENVEEPPPNGSYPKVTQLAKSHSKLIAAKKPQKGRIKWTPEEEGALIKYMAEFPQKYSQILKKDRDEGKILAGRSQVNLKDKAKNMATNMIKSGCGLMEGFDNVITRDSTYGERLMADGYKW